MENPKATTGNTIFSTLSQPSDSFRNSIWFELFVIFATEMDSELCFLFFVLGLFLIILVVVPTLFGVAYTLKTVYYADSLVSLPLYPESSSVDSYWRLGQHNDQDLMLNPSATVQRDFVFSGSKRTNKEYKVYLLTNLAGYEYKIRLDIGGRSVWDNRTVNLNNTMPLLYSGIPKDYSSYIAYGNDDLFYSCPEPTYDSEVNHITDQCRYPNSTALLDIDSGFDMELITDVPMLRSLSVHIDTFNGIRKDSSRPGTALIGALRVTAKSGLELSGTIILGISLFLIVICTVITIITDC